jgi:RNA polymerase sigma-70 factor (ECF subfamily)
MDGRIPILRATKPLKSDPNHRSKEPFSTETPRVAETGPAVECAVESAVKSTVESAVESTVESTVESAVKSAVESAVESTVKSTVKSTVESAVKSAVKSAVNSTVDEPVDDAELLRKAASGDGKAFHALVDRHAPRMYRLAVSLVGNAADAEDVLQETFTGVFKGMAKFEGRSAVKTWLTRILFTQAAKWRRDRIGKGMVSMDGIAGMASASATASSAPSSMAVEGATYGVGVKIDLDAALKRLSPEHREVLMLREFEGMTYEEMSAVLGLPRGTIESRLHRARNELRSKLPSYAI